MTTEPTEAEIWQMWMPMVRRMGVADPVEFARAVLAKWGTPAGAGGGHPYALQWDAELGRTAMRFVDRAGDVHPGIDDAGTICADFHAAMSAVIERMPHVQRMSPTPQPAQPQAGAVLLPKFLALKFHARRDKKATVTLLFPGHEAADAWVRGIKGGQHDIE